MTTGMTTVLIERLRMARSHTRLTRVLCVAVGSLLVGCDESTSPIALNCPDIATPAVVVTVLDASTGVADATGARGVALDGAYSDSLRPAEMLASGRLVSLMAAFERPGTYTVRVERPGYQAAERTGVVAAPAPCGVVTAEVALWLQPVP